MKKIVVVTLLLFYNISSIYAISIDTIQYSKLINSQNIDNQIYGHLKFALYLNDVKGFTEEANLQALQAIFKSKLSNKIPLFIYSTIIYAQVCDEKNVAKSEKYLLESLAEVTKSRDMQLQFQILICLSSLHTKYSLFEQATTYIQKAVKYIIEQKKNRFSYYLALADLQLRTNEKISSYENYYNALLIAREYEIDSLLFVSYFRLYHFYDYINEIEKAKEYLTASSALIANNKNFNLFDTLLLKAAYIDIYINNGENELALKLVDDIMPLVEKNKFYYIKELVFATLRTSYLISNNYKGICDLYCNKFPDELEKLKRFDIRKYYIVQSLIFENNSQIDSAKYFLQLAEDLILSQANSASIANFFHRKGQFYLRQNEPQTAMESFNKFYQYALLSKHFPFVINAASILDSIYLAQEDWKNAYHFSKIKAIYIDSNTIQTQKDKLLNLEIENISKLKDLENDKKILIENKRANIQVLVIIVAIIFSVILLVVISRFKISKNLLKLFSYVTFVLVFEFIVYLLDNIIHQWAHGQPLKIIAVKVVIISLLLPIHHATDYRVVQYLTRKNLVKDHGTSLKHSILKIWVNFRNWLNIHKVAEIAPETDTPKTEEGR